MHGVNQAGLVCVVGEGGVAVGQQVVFQAVVDSLVLQLVVFFAGGPDKQPVVACYLSYFKGTVKYFISF